MKSFLKNQLGTVFGKAVLGLLIAGVLLRWPVLTGWLGDDLQKDVLGVAYEIKSWAMAIVLMFAKSYNSTGGTKPITPEAETRVQGNP